MFLVNKHGHAVSPHEILETKEKATWFPTVIGDMAWYRDGFLCEVNFKNGLFCRGHVAMGLSRAFQQLYARIAPYGYSLSAEPTKDIVFDDTAPSDVYTLGCLPSKNFYGEPFLLAGVSPKTVPYRTAGCHVHLSTSDKTKWKDNEQLVPLFDKYVGLPLTYLTTHQNAEARRRTLYGRAGEYRLTAYKSGERGIEYRVPSGFLLTYAPLVSLALGVMREITHRSEGSYSCAISEHDEIRAMINESQVKAHALPSNTKWYTPNVLKRAREKLARITLTDWSVLQTDAQAHDFGWDQFRKGLAQ